MLWGLAVSQSASGIVLAELLCVRKTNHAKDASEQHELARTTALAARQCPAHAGNGARAMLRE